MDQPLNVRDASLVESPQRQARTKAMLIVGGLVVVGAGVAAIIAVAAKGGGGSGGGGNKPLQCSIDYCNKVEVASNATSCAQALCTGGCNSTAGARVVAKDAQGDYCALDCAGTLQECAQPKVMDRSATTCDAAECLACSDGADFALDPQTMLPTKKCSFVCTNNQLLNGCAPGSCSRDSSCSACVPGFAASSSLRGGSASCMKATAPTEMSFYMYRAQSDNYYPPENVDLASASGVMWYLHNEVMTVSCQPSLTKKDVIERHYGITIILRFKITMKNTQESFNKARGQLGHYTTFDSGRCTNQDCENIWTKYGYNVGCQPMIADNYPAGAWYSLPGRCPSLQYNDPHKADCNGKDEPGGQCAQPNGTTSCTWHAELIDNITVNDFCGIQNYQDWCKAGNLEYDRDTDRGTGCTFWDDKQNADRNKDRVLRLHQLFAEKHPGITLPDPLCDGY